MRRDVVLETLEAPNFVLDDLGRWRKQASEDIVAEPDAVSLQAVGEEPAFDPKEFKQWVRRMLLAEVLPDPQVS